VLEHLARPLADRDELAWVLPEAIGGSWYPGRFNDVRATNEPWLSDALAACEAAVGEARNRGLPADRVVVIGFAQGACLVADLLTRPGRRYAGAAILSGSLLGPDEDPSLPLVDLDRLPMLVTCSTQGAWTYPYRARHTATAFSASGAAVTYLACDDPERRIAEEELEAVRVLLDVASA
jgi:phospholipase/carboxylesterase